MEAVVVEPAQDSRQSQVVASAESRGWWRELDRVAKLRADRAVSGWGWTMTAGTVFAKIACLRARESQTSRPGGESSSVVGADLSTSIRN